MSGMTGEGRGARVKNRAPAPVQITAEQLLREAESFQEKPQKAARQRVEDFEELHEYRGRKRQEFEETIRRTRSNIRAWIKYANWEASQNEFPRSRSVYERALDVEPSDLKIWLSYTEMELKARNVQHARNLFDRAVTLLPRIDQIWYKYVYLEELLGNIAGARQVFERWMAWEPNEKAWSAYIKMEVRYNEMDRASAVWERLVACHPEPKMWTKWAKFEEERQRLDRAREIYQMALEFFGEEEDQLSKAQGIYSSFAKFETRHKEYDRARIIYKYALDRLPRSKSANLYASYSTFEKQFGNRSGIESTVLGKRRIQYEEEIAHEPMNYDTWFDYTRLEEDAFRNNEGGSDQTASKVREAYERAVANVPPSNEKTHWRRYIYLWLNYALFEEMDTKDYERCRQVYQAAVKLVPHKRFTFAKLWLNFAQFELRRLQLDSARKVMGAAIGMCPKEKLFKGYLEMELSLREFDRARMLYERFIENDSSNSAAWINFAQLERMLGDYDRARAIFELAITQLELDMPELLWKAYIDYEFEEEEWDRMRALYDRLLEKTSHVKVWVSYAQAEFNAAKVEADNVRPDEEDGAAAAELVDVEAIRSLLAQGLDRARVVFDRGYKDLKGKGLKEERVVLLEAWKSLETNEGDEEHLTKVEAMMPRVIKKRRKVDEDGSMEEYFDMVFPDDEQQGAMAGHKLLQMAHLWKQKQQQAAAQVAPPPATVDDGT